VAVSEEPTLHRRPFRRRSVTDTLWSAHVQVVGGLTQAHVSFIRIVDFLNLPEVRGRLQDAEPCDRKRRAAALRGGSFAWGSGADGPTNKPVLHDLEVELPVGRLTVISGPCGSGKSVRP
jgi:ABC-type bacteriocin/lantibiotic exporter with double-glycine peptidase domain